MTTPKRVCAGSAVLFGLLAGCTGTPEPIENVGAEPEGSTLESAAIYGRIVDERGEPLRGSQIVVVGTPKATLSDSTGSYSLHDIAAGEYLVRGEHLCHANDVAQVRLRSGERERVDLQLRWMKVQLAGGCCASRDEINGGPARICL